jgi:hypothetical protein
MPVPVNVHNFARAETDRMFVDLQKDAGAVNAFHHAREPTPIDHQTVIRMNRDTLYSIAVVDLTDGATVTIPEAGGRYVSVMIVNEDHYINRVFHEAGEHQLTIDEFETSYVAVGARVLVDPGDAKDVAEVNALQDQFGLTAGSAQTFVMPEYDQESFDRVRSALLELAKSGIVTTDTFGKKEEVNPVHHLIGTAAGWGGLPASEAFYTGAFPGLPGDGQYKLTVGDVPVDGFWSISLYNADGFFEPNDRNAYSVNNITAMRNDDGSVTVHFGGDDGQPNLLPIMDGWNYIVRLYRPRQEVLDGTWSFPPIERA